MTTATIETQFSAVSNSFEKLKHQKMILDFWNNNPGLLSFVVSDIEDEIAQTMQPSHKSLFNTEEEDGLCLHSFAFASKEDKKFFAFKNGLHPLTHNPNELELISIEDAFPDANESAIAELLKKGKNDRPTDLEEQLKEWERSAKRLMDFAHQ